MSRILASCFVAVVALALWPQPGRAGPWVEMKPGDFGAEAEFIGRFVFERYERDEIYLRPYKRERDIHVGRFDLSGNGVAELFVTIRHSEWCGSIGCPYDIFEKRGGVWRDIGGGPLLGRVMDERVCGYRSLKGTEGIYRWNGEYYGFAYCSPDQVECRSMAIEYDEPEKLDPDNGLIAPEDCPKPDRAKR